MCEDASLDLKLRVRGGSFGMKAECCRSVESVLVSGKLQITRDHPKKQGV